MERAGGGVGGELEDREETVDVVGVRCEWVDEVDAVQDAVGWRGEVGGLGEG